MVATKNKSLQQFDTDDPDRIQDLGWTFKEVWRRIRGLVVTTLNLILANKEYLMGDFSIADAALYYTEFWAVDVAGWELPKNVKAHYEKMKTRPSVQASRKLEGLS